MTLSKESQAKYWDEVWTGRTKSLNPWAIEMNNKKMAFLIECIIARPYYVDLDKLDIGCGTGVHHNTLRHKFPNWPDRLTGIDLSPVAVRKARFFGLDCEVANLYDYQPDKQFDAFFMLDSLEHFDSLEGIAEKIDELGRGDYFVFGNIPLYATTTHKDGAFERNMDLNTVAKLLASLGFGYFWQHIYGCYGYPYMVFEAKKNHRTHRDVIEIK